jgi:ATP-dependent DNA helicase 2 subunit 1
MADLDNRGEEGDEDEELNETVYKSLKDAVLFAIEVSPSMLEGGDHSAVVAALKCGFQLMQQRIISNPNDMMGILLFGTQKSKFQSQDDRGRESLTYPHCYLLADLDIPAAEDVKALKSLIEDKDDFEKLLIPSTDPVSMSNVLFCANQVLTTRAANFTSRRLFVITDNDNPHSNDKTLRSAATVRAKDLYDLGVIIELFPISRPDHEFDQSQFYDV